MQQNIEKKLKNQVKTKSNLVLKKKPACMVAAAGGLEAKRHNWAQTQRVIGGLTQLATTHA